MNSTLKNVIIFVIVLIALNLIFSAMGWAIHISIIGSLVLTALIWVIMRVLSGGGTPR